MTEHPIIFSTDMVKAILEGRKTMTRRVIKPRPKWTRQIIQSVLKPIQWFLSGTMGFIKCPYGQAGDGLWIRETWWSPSTKIYKSGVIPDVMYRADYPTSKYRKTETCLCGHKKETKRSFKWKPSIHMPRWASRINLEITNIRVEKLQEITEEDAKAEGVTPYEVSHQTTTGQPLKSSYLYVRKFKELWNSLHEKPKPIICKGVITHYVSYPWKDIRETRKYRGKPWYVFGNPYCWVIEFKK